MLDDFDVATAAGGINRAHVEEFLVDVSDGDGLQIEASAAARILIAGYSGEVPTTSEPFAIVGSSNASHGNCDGLAGDGTVDAMGLSSGCAETPMANSSSPWAMCIGAAMLVAFKRPRRRQRRQ